MGAALQGWHNAWNSWNRFGTDKLIREVADAVGANAMRDDRLSLRHIDDGRQWPAVRTA